jgi:hypothetical protein
MRIFLLTLLLHGSFQLFAQTGNYFLSHYSPREEQFDNVCFDIVQDPRGIVYFATRGGIQQFDGRNWSLIPGNGAVYALQITDQGDLLWGGASGYGKLENHSTGGQTIAKLSGEEVRDVFQALAIRDKAYFLTENAVVACDLNLQQPVTIKSTTLTGPFTGIFELFGSAYLNTQDGGILKVENNKLVSSTLGLPDEEDVVFSSGSPHAYLLGLSDNRVFLCSENLRLTEIKLQDSTYIDASVIVSGAWINRDLFVLGTLRGGMVFVQTSNGKTQEVINYNTGLPDNEVYTLMIDKSQCVWAAHEYGFTRVSPYLPYRSFGHYPGLSGNLLCATSFQGSVYVGTSLGLFKLEKEDVYEETTNYINVEIKNKKAAARQSVSEPDKPGLEAESKKGGFLRFLRRRSSSTETVPDKKPAPAPVKETRSSRKKDEAKFRKIKKTERVLRSSSFVYKKVKGIEAKITQLLELDDRLIAVGLGGAYQVHSINTTPILEEPVRMAFVSPSRDMLFVSTYANEVKAFQPGTRNWRSTNLFQNLDDQITSIFEGVQNELWLCALDKAYRLDISSQEVTKIQTIEISNPNFDEIAGIRWRDDIVLAHSQGFFRFDRAQNVFVKIDTLPKPTHYFTGYGNILYNDAHSWNVFGSARESNLQLLNLLNNLRFVTLDQVSGNFWVITRENELYKFLGEKFTPDEAGYPLLLKIVRGGGEKNKRDIFQFEEQKPLTFEVVQPDYLAAQAIEYRYQLRELDKTWSDWSSHNNAIDFPYLPSGDYSLQVQSRDIFGKIKDLNTFSFEVLPPYWRRPWFYALEFFVFASLVLLSFRLSTRYRIISRILSLLTIIMLIQLIQTVIGETFETKASPVTDFFIQVLVAFMILPVEGYLRNLMLRSLDTHSGIYRFLTPKANPATQEKEPEQ